METERIEFPDGSWWEFATKKTYGVQRAVQAVIKKHLKAIPDTQNPTQMNIDIDWPNVDFEEANRVMVLKSTTAWSFGEVNSEVMNNIPCDYVEKVLVRMNELYSSGPFAVRPPVST